MKNSNSNLHQILRYWHTLEYLAPFNLDQQIDQADSNKLIHFRLDKECEDDDLPWFNPLAKKSLELDLNKYYKYQIYFGIFDARLANNQLLQLFGKKDRRDTRNDFLSCYGRFSLDNTGVPIPESLSLSSLPWALGHLQSGEFSQTITNSNWNELFRAYSSSVSDKLKEKAASLQATDVRFNAEDFKDLITDLTGLSDWKSIELKTLAYCFAVEERQVFKSKKEKTNDPLTDESALEDDDTKILNSFFVDDLQKVSEAFAQDNCGAGIKSFLREKEVSEASKFNLDDRKVLEAFVAPQHIPLGRWASKDDNYQSLMQQAGINIALSKSEQNGNLFSVNGPPGTGKSTLLRDIMAALMVERAKYLTSFDNPHDAFAQVSEIPVGKGVKIQLFKPDSKIVGYEIVVASSNNTAVQNITQEIPGKDSIGQDYLNEAAYFQEVAENVFAKNEKIKPWGMVAAVLGNADNRNRFRQRFWFDEPTEDVPDRVSFRSYLKYSDSVSLTDWKFEKTKFLELRNQISVKVTQRQNYFNSLEEKRRLIKELEDITRKIQTSQKELEETKNAARRVEIDLSSVESERKENLEDIEGIKSSKPYFIEFWLAYIFKRSKVDEYNQNMENAQKEREQIKTKKKNLEKKLRLLETQVGETERSVHTITKKYDLVSEAKNANDKFLAVGKQNLGTEAFADENWWNKDEKELQLRAPWLDKELNKLRARLFLQAMKLHEVFIRVARSKISKNLNLWTNILSGNLTLEKNEYYRYLWQTFFLVVPVVSTTFASFGRMFADLGRESLGWLLIDEAGQAVPQAAVGAIWRAKNTVIVGDPLQIEPVIGLNETVIEQVRQHYKIDAEWSLVTASVQTLADRVNQFGAYISNDLSRIWVGCPLRVHRRCVDPMFTIANEIAYENKMVYATADPQKDKIFIGKSRWIHVAGKCAHGHWVNELWLEVKKILAEASANKDNFPKLYIISPFRDVARELKKLAVKERKSWLPHLQISEKDVKSWASKSIGTVHTFQGKEDETVIFVLGADEDSISSAQWAANKPNMLNVAATRAKYRFYIVGNSRVWSNLRNFETAYGELKISENH